MSSVLEDRTDSRPVAIAAIVRKRATAIGCKPYHVEAAILAALSAYNVGRHSAFRSVRLGLRQAMSLVRLSAATPHEQALAIIRHKAIFLVKGAMPIFEKAVSADIAERMDTALSTGNDYAIGLCSERRLADAIAVVEDIYSAMRAKLLAGTAVNAYRFGGALHVVEAALYALDPVIDYSSINRCVRAAKEFSL